MLRARWRSRLALAARPPPRRANDARGPAYFSAGISPSNKPESSASSTVNPRIQQNLTYARQIRRANGQQQTHAGISERSAEDSAHQPQHHAFNEESSDHSSPTRAERGAHGQFLLSRLDPHQQQIRHVSARDEHHQPDCSHHHPENVADVANDFPL